MLRNLLRILCPLASSKRVPTLPTLRWTSRTWTFSGQVPCFSVGDSLLLQSFPKCPILKFWRTSIAFTLLMLEREWEKDAFNSMGYHLRLAPAEKVVKPTVPSLICHPPHTHQEWQRGQHPIRDCTFSKAEQQEWLHCSLQGVFGSELERGDCSANWSRGRPVVLAFSKQIVPRDANNPRQGYGAHRRRSAGELTTFCCMCEKNQDNPISWR